MKGFNDKPLGPLISSFKDSFNVRLLTTLYTMANSSGDNILNFVIGIILVVGGIASTWVALYPRLSFDKATRYVEPDTNTTKASLIQPNESM